MKTYGEVGGITPINLTSALYRGELSVSRRDHFNPGERVPSTHWIEGLVGNRVGLEAVG
jgi:hypothetical protein